MTRVAHSVARGRGLDDAARVHHGDRSAIEATSAMSCEMKTTARPAVALASQQLDDLRLHRHVERRGRLVGDQDLRRGDQRQRERDALAHAARELVRILPQRLRRHSAAAPTRAPRARDRAARRGRKRRAPASTSTSWSSIRRCGVSAFIGSWTRAPICAPRTARSSALGPAEDLPAVDPHRAARSCALRGKQPERREERLALAGAGLADDREAFARADVERDAVDGGNAGASAWRS